MLTIEQSHLFLDVVRGNIKAHAAELCCDELFTRMDLYNVRTLIRWNSICLKHTSAGCADGLHSLIDFCPVPNNGLRRA